MRADNLQPNVNLSRITDPTKEELEEVFQCFERNLKIDRRSLQAMMYYPPFNKNLLLYVLKNKNNRIVGVYLLEETGIQEEFPPKEYPSTSKWTGNGIHGIALVLDEEYRGHGLGRQLINLPRKLGYDYVWGMQLKSAKNIHYWLRRRELVLTTFDSYVTAERLS